MELKRTLSHQTPALRGDDIASMQQRLMFLGYSRIGKADGIFGKQTETTIKAFQQTHKLVVDGIVGKNTWKAIFKPYPPASFQAVTQYKPELIRPHGYKDSVIWQLSADGIHIEDNSPEVTRGKPQTIERIWNEYGPYIEASGKKHGVPVELILATICTETHGKPGAIREEPGYVSDEETPHKVSPGIMQTLISTARIALKDNSIDRNWLLQAQNSIEAGTAYIARQKKVSQFDPPKVACAYNAGGIYHNKSDRNRWKMRQYPIGSPEHADRFVKWFNDCFRFFAQSGIQPEASFYLIMSESDQTPA